MPRPLAVLFCLLVLLAALPARAGETRTVTDAAGRLVTVPAAPKRLVCLGPGCLRLTAYLQATDRVVGIERFETARRTGRPYNLAHPELLTLPVIGPGGPQSIDKEPDLEALLAVAPEVIFASAMEPGTAQRLSDKLGIPVVIVSYGAFGRYDTKVFDTLAMMGTILGREARAKEVAGFMQSVEADVRARAARGLAAPGYVRPGVYVGGTGMRGSHGLTSTDNPYPPLAWLGADNVAAGLVKDGHGFLDKEQLLSLRPDILFLDASGLAAMAEELSGQPDFAQSLPAVAAGRVYVLYPFTSYLTNLGTIVADAYAAGKILYPEAFADIDPAAKADAVYAFMVGRPVYADMAKDFGPLGRTFPITGNTP